MRVLHHLYCGQDAVKKKSYSQVNTYASQPSEHVSQSSEDVS